jgi:hypothetical protein
VVGQFPPPGLAFPASSTAALLLSHHELALLASFYNEDFGIVIGDQLAHRHEKFIQFVCGHM